ncbi:MAG: DMT family transporter [Euryarchaeota archaeon]|nr:DMT family transporter [Euryarchaeota archaeon]
MSTPVASPAAWVAVFVLILVQLLFGALSVAGKFALAAFPPLGLAALRVVVSGILLVIIERIWVRERVAPRHLALLALYSLFGVVGNQVLFISGLARTEAVPATVLVTTIPVWTLLVAVVLGVERPGWRKYAGVTLALVGVAIMVGVTAAAFRLDVALGNLMVTLNALSYAIYLVIARRLLREYDALTVAAWTFLFGSLVIVPLGLPDLVGLDWGAVPASAWLALLYIILGGTVAAYALNNWALRHVASTTVAAYIYLQPIVATALAVTLLGERPTLRTLTGALFIFAGVWFAVVARKSGRVRIA